MADALKQFEEKMDGLLSSRAGEIKQIESALSECKTEISKFSGLMDNAVRTGNTDDYIQAKNKISFLESKKEMLTKRLDQIRNTEMVSPETTREEIGKLHTYLYVKEMELTEKVIVSLEQLRSLMDQVKAIIDQADEAAYTWDKKVSKYTDPKMPKVKPSPLYEYHNIFPFLGAILDHPGFTQIKEEYDNYQHTRKGK